MEHRLDGEADRIDQVQAAWRAELPGVDVGSIGVVGRAVELVHRVEQARGAALAGLGSDRATFDLLATLRRAGRPYELTVGELQRLSLVTTGAVSQRVERAARAGLVHRRPVPGDARRVVVGLTEAGVAAAAAQLVAVLDAEREVLRPLTDDQRRALEQLLRAWALGYGVPPVGQDP
ncbi:MarR family winged helix-turn-helix transcriptional regulator [Modestobacter sp. NPDC049651]|uniref:MarR family winged helix-turn-helix transcriptional regulator n=1 Tax=unclassified Modestobacter TaxID=2643866 RepID=UPI0033CDE92D